MSAFSSYIKEWGTKNASNIIWFTAGLLVGVFVI